MGERTTVKAACRNCHGGCSALLTVEDGRLVKIAPDPEGPLSKGRMCAKGLSGIELLYHPDRLKYPMRRAGARGEGKWERITWDEAYDEMAQRLRSIIDRYGAESICVAQGTGRHMFHHVPRFANTLGTPNWIEPGFAQCFFPRVQVGMLCFGASPIADYYGPVKPKCILVWGHNHELTSAGSECQFLINDAIRAGAKLIVVDPRRTRLARHAEHWLPLRPGTDDALALGMLNVIINEDLYDHDFVENWCHGFEALRERVQDYPPGRVAEITWIPEGDIVAAARTFAAAKPATLEWGVGIEHTPNTTQTVRAISLLMAITGNYDVPGGWLEDLGVLPAAGHNNHLLSEAQGKKRLGEGTYRILAGNHNPFPSAHIPSVLDAAITGKPYPIKSFLHFGNNGVISNADARKTARALRAAEFNVCMDHFMTPTAELCDLVLPAAMWMELDEIHCAPDWGHTILVQKQVVRPYDVKSDEEVFCELCARMGLPYGAEKPSDIYDEQLRQAAERYPQLEGVDFAAMKERSYLQIPYEYRKYEKRGGFRTPTGKVELYSTVFESLGYDPLPCYEEPPESPYSSPELLRDYPYVLTTGGRRIFYFCSEGRQVDTFRRAHSFPQVEIHPDTAARHGIADGDMVYIESPRGRIVQKAWVHDGIHPRVINCEYGWWFPEREGPDHGCYDSNCNVLTSMEGKYDPCMGTYQLRGLLCRISRAEDQEGADAYGEALRAGRRPIDASSPSVAIDPNLCVLCGNCVHTCQSVQGIGALEFVTNAQGTMAAAEGGTLSGTGCVGCGQCAQVCPTGAIRVKNSADAVLEAIGDPDAVVIAQIAPSVRVGLSRELGLPEGENALGLLTALLRSIGFDRVYDTVVGADLTVLEESAELTERLERGGPLPLLTSCCPAWVKFCEDRFPAFSSHISTCRSPHQMLGAVIRARSGQEARRRGKRLVSVSVMPCSAKKAEILRPESATAGVQDVDYVLTAAELGDLIRRLEIDVSALTPQSADEPFSAQSGSGVIFGASGGVLEAVLRHLAGDTGGSLRELGVRGGEGLREFSLEWKGRTLRAAVTSGLQNAAALLERVERGEAHYHVVEVMACPGGCMMGGGQPPLDPWAWRTVHGRRGEGLDQTDRAAPASESAQNQQAAALRDGMSPQERRALLHRARGTADEGSD